MRWTVIKHENGEMAVAIRDGEAVADLSTTDPFFKGDLLEVIKSGPDARERARSAMTGAKRLPAGTVRHALPITRPGKIVCLGLNYIDHANEGGYKVLDYPALFLRTPASLVAHGDGLVHPGISEKFDYEAEFMAVIGKGGRHISEENALTHVFGYTLFNDGSVRDFQHKTAQWIPGKNFDRSGSVGPDVVTADELPPGCMGLSIQSRINGEVLQNANTSDMVFSVAKTIAVVSQFSALEPGDLIAMGTPAGVGHARNPPRWMQTGDVVEIEVEGLGILRNRVVDEP